MPSSTFFNLPENKKNKLIKCAIEEFLNVDYMQVSINKIINRAQISRGSFYMYFDGKEELFEYILHSFQDKLIQVIRKVFVSNNGDLRNSFIELFDEISLEIDRNNYNTFFKNFFLFLNTKEGVPPNPSVMIFKQVKDDINTNINMEDLQFIFDVFLHNLFTSIADALKSQNIDDNRKKYLRKINIICYGIYNKENRK